MTGEWHAAYAVCVKMYQPHSAVWGGTPELGVFQFLNLIMRTGNGDDVSEGRALYLLPQFIKCDLKREQYNIMPSLQGGRSGEVNIYFKLVSFLLRKYADEESLSDQDAPFHGAAQEGEEAKLDFYERIRELRRLCGFIQTEGQMKSRYMQGLGWEVLTDVREKNTLAISVELLQHRQAASEEESCLSQTS